MNTAIRLVRCPKCQKILAELPDIHVQTCGGCGAILQANQHKDDIKVNAQRAQENDPIHKHEPNEHKVEIKANALRAQETNPIQKYEPSHQMNTTIRLVRCPKCQKILAELPDIHVQTCGGCGAILQAGENKNGTKGNGLRVQETDPVQKREPIFGSRNLGNEIGQYIHDAEDSHSEPWDQEGKHSNEPQSFDENGRSHSGKSLGAEKGEVITHPIGPLIRSMVFPPLSTDEEYLKGSPEVGPSFHRINSEEMLDTLPINERVPIVPLSHDDIYMEEPHEVGPGFHLISSSDEMLYSLPINSRDPVGLMSKSPTRTYYGGDGNKSSYDGTELSAQVSHRYARKIKGAGITSTKISRQKDRFRVTNKQNGELQMLNERQDQRRHESPQSRKQLHLSSVSYMARSSQLLDRNESPESSRHMLGPDPEKVELLRMVYELEDRIKHTHISKQLSGEILPFRDVGEEILSGGYYDHPTTGRNQYYEHVNMYPSYSPDLQHYSSLEFSDEIQDDKQKIDHEMKMVYLREKHQVAKRHIRPVSGGAPIINCYHCSELLQLSADFLFFRRRCHRIRCNSCNRILKFSLLKKSHLVPYVIKIQAHSPSEMDNFSNIQLLDHHPLQQIP